MMFDTHEEIEGEIRQAKDSKSRTNKYGPEEWNAIAQIVMSADTDITYMGRPLPRELVEHAESAVEFHRALERDIVRASYPGFEKLPTFDLLMQRYRGQDVLVILNSFTQGLLTSDEAGDWCDIYAAMRDTSPFIERYTELRGKTDAVHDELIEFYESLISG